MNKIFTVSILLVFLFAGSNAQQKKIYLALDDHTDYMWSNDEEEYKQAFLKTLDYYIKLNDSTAGEPYPYQNKWNCDGSLWIYTYEKNRSAEEFNRLIRQIKDGKITFPLNISVGLYGIAPAEATLRSMYYSGTLERKYGIDLKLAYIMEDQVMPLGLSSLWAGSGAEYSWHGVCACATKVKNLKVDGIYRPHEIYWYKGLDDQKVLMKWNTISWDNMHLGGYAEAAIPSEAIAQSIKLMDDKNRYPYLISGAFGVGWDNLITLTNKYVSHARNLSTKDYQVIVSNEIDFFEEFDKKYGRDLPSETISYGTTEWGIGVASLAEVSASVKRSVEKLRAAEALYTFAALIDENFGSDLAESRMLAWNASGLYFEHDWTCDGTITRHDKALWQRKIANQLKAYVDTLYNRGISRLSKLILKEDTSNEMFYVFNPLGWKRTDYCDYIYNGPSDVRVIDNTTMQEVPFQFIFLKNKTYLRIMASEVPSMGYKVFKILPGRGNLKMENTGYYLNFSNFAETPFYKIVFAPDGAIRSLIDKTNPDREYVKSINGLYLNDMGTEEEVSYTSIRIENDGPVSMTLVAQSEKPFRHTTKLTLFRNIDRIELENYLTQNFGDNTVAYSFPINIAKPEIWHEEAGAVLKVRPQSQGGHYAEIFNRVDWIGINHFADISEPGTGMILSNRDAYFMKTGKSKTDSLDYTTPLIDILAAGRIDADINLGIPNQDGDSYFENFFAIKPYNGSFDATSSMKFSLEHQNPLIAAKITGTSSLYPGTNFSLFTISDPDILTWALKPSEEGIENGIVLRVWNTSREDRNCTISSSGKIESCNNITHIETDISGIKPEAGKITARIGHNRMQSFRIFLNKKDLALSIP